MPHTVKALGDPATFGETTRSTLPPGDIGRRIHPDLQVMGKLSSPPKQLELPFRIYQGSMNFRLTKLSNLIPEGWSSILRFVLGRLWSQSLR